MVRLREDVRVSGSMSVSEDEVRYIASLAKLSFSDKERTVLAKEMESVLEYMRILNSVNTESVAPMVRVSDSQEPLRKDLAKSTITSDEALRNAPDVQGDYFRVPKVIG